MIAKHLHLIVANINGHYGSMVSYITHPSRTTIVVHSRDDQEISVAHKVKSPENQPHFCQTMMGQYWLGKTKPKQAFRSTRNAFKKLPRRKVYLTEFSTDD